MNDNQLNRRMQKYHIPIVRSFDPFFDIGCGLTVFDEEALAQAERDRRWREDPLNLMPYLRLEGLRYRVADGLRAIAYWVEG